MSILGLGGWGGVGGVWGGVWGVGGVGGWGGVGVGWVGWGGWGGVGGGWCRDCRMCILQFTYLPKPKHSTGWLWTTEFGLGLDNASPMSGSVASCDPISSVSLWWCLVGFFESSYPATLAGYS